MDLINLENCRLCYTQPGVYQIKGNAELINLIFEYLKIEVIDSLMDALPPKICENCDKFLKGFASYQKQIQSIDTSLRNGLKSSIVETQRVSCQIGSIIQEEEPAFDFDNLTYVCNLCLHVLPTKFSLQEHMVLHDIDLNDLNGYEVVKEQQTLILDLNNPKELIEQVAVNAENLDPAQELDVKSETKEDTQRPEAGRECFPCKFFGCNKVFKSKRYLNTHVNKHQNNRKFLCTTCGKGFLTKLTLGYHEKTHLEVKAHPCKLCNKSFRVASTLRTHEQKAHEGLRFHCGQCGQAYLSKHSLERHRKTHAGIKGFPCEFCPKAFYSQNDLARHKRYHLNERRFQCGRCSALFFEKEHLTKHEMCHTGERPHVCTSCGKGFVDSYRLKMHRNSKHK